MRRSTAYCCRHPHAVVGAPAGSLAWPLADARGAPQTHLAPLAYATASASSAWKAAAAEDRVWRACSVARPKPLAAKSATEPGRAAPPSATLAECSSARAVGEADAGSWGQMQKAYKGDISLALPAFTCPCTNNATALRQFRCGGVPNTTITKLLNNKA